MKPRTTGPPDENPHDAPGSWADLQVRTLEAVCASGTDGESLAAASKRFARTLRKEAQLEFVMIERIVRGSAETAHLAGAFSSGSAGTLKIPTPLLQRVVKQRKEYIAPSHPAGVAAAFMRAHKLRSLAVLPLATEGRVTGLLSIGSVHAWDRRGATTRFFRAIASRASALLEEHIRSTRSREVSERYAALFRGTLDTVFVIDPDDGQIVEVNPQASRLTGYTRRELTKMTIYGLQPPDRQEEFRLRLTDERQRATFVRGGPLEIIQKGGKRVPVELYTSNATIAGRKATLAIMHDLSEQKRTEVKLAASEELLRIIVEGTLDMFFYVHDVNGVFTYVSPSAEKITGFPPDHWKVHYSRFLTANPINEKVRLYTDRALKEGTPAPVYPCEIAHADGRTLLLEISEKPIFKEGKVIGIQGVAQDITEKKGLEEAILASRDNLNRILDQTPLAVMVLDARGNLVDVNEAWLRLFGATEKNQVVGKINAFHSKFIKSVGLSELIASVYDGQIVDVPPITIDPRSARPELPLNGVERSVHVRMFPVIDRNGGLVNVVAMMEDVTEKRRLEEQLVQSQKMESIGLLAGGIAHDFNNILGGILGYASFVKSQVSKQEKIYPHLETIERSALRAAELTSQLLAFARGGKYVVGPMYINDLVHETAELLRGTIEKNISVETRLDSVSPVIEADASQMQQVLMNLCVNARDAMPGGGTLTISTRCLREPDSFLRSLRSGQQDSFVCIDISDTGIGIDKAIRGKIFDPFFTTKEKGKGTGLGLATVYGIVRNHGGYINVESEVGTGTTFSVYIPAVEKPAARPVQAEARMTGGKETILVVDDEETIRTLVRDILEEIGYHVLGAGNGQEAIEIYQHHSSPIDLVILDMTMPGMGGRETFEKLKERDPGVRAILSTGYSQDERAREVLALGVKGFVQKPYRINELAAAVRKVLDSQTS